MTLLLAVLLGAAAGLVVARGWYRLPTDTRYQPVPAAAVIAAAVVLVGAAQVLGSTMTVALALVTVVAGAIDLDVHRVPNTVTAAAAAGTGLVTVVTSPGRLWPAAAAAAAIENRRAHD